MSAQTPEALCEVLEKSELLTPEQIDEVRQNAAAGVTNPIALLKPLIQNGTVTKWQAKILLAGRIGFKLGKYILLDRMGQKDAGDVYVAKHSQLNRKVAIKTLSKEQTQDQQSLKKFLVNAREIAKLDHQNITRLYDIDREGTRYFLVLQQVAGQDLQSVIEETGPLAPDYVGNYIMQAADGLAHAHQNGMFHRAITPANLLVDDEGVVKLLNLGVPHSTSGTDFSAPEVVDGNPGDHLSDLYALGATGLYLLTGKDPKTNKTQPTTGLEKVLRKMMLATPEKRVKSAQSVSTLLQKWLAQYVPQPEPTVVEADLDDLDQGLDELADLDDLDAIDEMAPAADPLDAFASAEQEAPGVGVDPLADPLAAGGQETQTTANAFTSPFDTQPAATAEPDEPKPTPAAVADPSKRFSGGAIAGLAIGGGAAMLAFVSLLTGLLYLSLFGNFAHANSPNISADGSVASSVFDVFSESTPASSLVALTEGLTKEIENMDPPPIDEDGEPGDDPIDDENLVAKADVPGDDNENKAADDQEKVDDKPDDPKPAPAPKKPMPKPMPKKPMPPKRVNPFKALPAVVNLPETSSTDEVSLGPLDSKPTDQILTDLVGGDMASRGGKPKFTMNYGNGGVSQTDFDFFMESPGSDKVNIAKIAIRDKKLNFRWTADAAKDVGANYLRNCVVAFTALGGETHSMMFRQPVQMEKITFDAKKSSIKSQLIALDHLPDAEHIRFEITLPKNFPKSKPDPGLDFAALDGSMSINIGDPVGVVKGKDVYAAFVRMDVKVGARASINGSFRVTGTSGRAGPFNEKTLNADIQKMDAILRGKILVDAEWKKIRNKNDRNQFIGFLRKTGTQFTSPIQVQQFVGDIPQLQASIGKLRNIPAQANAIIGSQIGVKIYFQTIDSDGLPAEQVVLAKSN